MGKTNGEEALQALQFLPETQELKRRTVGLLNSDAARDVRFSCNGMRFTGQNFDEVANLITDGRILFRTGNVSDKAEAAYRANLDVIDVPRLDYGKAPFQRYALVHECVHA